MKKVLAAALAALAAIASFADAPTVTDVVAKQRYPWNGLVDITCTVSGVQGVDGEAWFSVAAVMPGAGTTRRASHVWVVRDGENSTDRQVRTDGNYRLLWDARTDLGQVSYSNMVVRVTITVRKKIQLWAGGPYWADANIGAELPSDSGYYFWWGDTVGYKWENEQWVASDGSSSGFSFSEANALIETYGKDIATLQSAGWIVNEGGTNVLAPEHDAAQAHWGEGWRMPTWHELQDLIDNCDWTPTTLNGVDGYEVRGKGDYASNSIFLPAAGSGVETSLSNSGQRCYFWSSDPYSSGNASMYLYFNLGLNHGIDGNSYRGRGRIVRPVQDAE